MATAFASGSGTRVYVCYHQRDGDNIRRGRTEIQRDQATVERFNSTLARSLFGHQYPVKMGLPEGQRSSEWIVRLPAVVSALNGEVTRLIGKKPPEGIKQEAVYSNPLLPTAAP